MLGVMLAAAVAANASGIQFIEDDYPAALAQARSEHKPVLVDSWASWCHTCLSMKRFVIPDPGLRPVKDAVVWLAIDSENPKNNAFLDRFPLDAWPTFLVIEPRGERVVGRWVGAASVNDFRAFVQEGARAAGSEKHDAATAALHKGYEARAKGDFASAASDYRKALELTRKDDPARPERLVLLSMALLRAKTPEAARECVQLGLREMDHAGDTSVATDFLATADGCAQRLPADDPQVAKLREKRIARLTRLIANAEYAACAFDGLHADEDDARRSDHGGNDQRCLFTRTRRARRLINPWRAG